MIFVGIQTHASPLNACAYFRCIPITSVFSIYNDYSPPTIFHLMQVSTTTTLMLAQSAPSNSRPRMTSKLGVLKTLLIPPYKKSLQFSQPYCRISWNGKNILLKG